MNRRHSLPAEVCALVERTPATVLLECSRANDPDRPGGPDAGFLTRLFVSPLRVITANEPAELPGLFAEIERAAAAGLFAAGYFAYECGGSFEPTAAMRPSRTGQPLAWLGIYDRAYLFDHRTGVFLDGDPPGLAQFRDGKQNDERAAELAVGAAFALTEPQYAERIAAIHEWIRAGDVYQLNFTIPYDLNVRGSAASLYAHLRSRQPVEFGAFLHWKPGRRILSFSPELFFQLEDAGLTRRITTRPMKGTARRGRTTREDRELAAWLRSDPKNRSENVMIVDLLRNDLGRLCKFGSVRAENLFALERHPTLWQMTSTVTGELRPEIGFAQIFRALFPCGSITGAPKVRAMQLLAQIEDEPRGVYTGAIGYFSRERTVFSVAIRTLELNGDHGRMGVGSGIVIDSDAAEEFRECALKAEFLTRDLNRSENPSGNRYREGFCLIESLLWEEEYPLLELHLDRLQDSAGYFGFPCGRAEAKAALLARAQTFVDRQPRKVRLLLDGEANMPISDEPLSARGVEPLRVYLASERTDANDPMLFHKTTHRPLYVKALRMANEAGFEDALFLNLRGEVTEGAISNIFVVKDGRWFTPPVECGLLAGVYRRYLLETQPGIEERVLFLDDLRQADEVYVSNAVRGLRRAIVDWEDRGPGQASSRS